MVDSRGADMRMIRAGVVTALPAVLVLTLAGTALASGKLYTDGHCIARGQYATCVAGGTAHKPTKLYADAWVNHSQRLTVYYDVTCAKGTGAGGKSGHFTIYVRAGRRATHKVPHPYYHPDYCIVSIDAQINVGSYLHLRNQYRKY
jgi:hypothetical protein